MNDDPPLGQDSVEAAGLISKEVTGGRRLAPDFSNSGNWVFYTTDESYLGMDMLVTQTANLFFADYIISQISFEELESTSALLPDKIYKVPLQSQFEIHIYPSCDGIYMLPIDLDDMVMYANSPTPSTQPIPTLEDEHDLLLTSPSLCGTPQTKVLLNGSEISWLTSTLS